MGSLSQSVLRTFLFNIIVKDVVGGAINIGPLIGGKHIKSYRSEVIVVINSETRDRFDKLIILIVLLIKRI